MGVLAEPSRQRVKYAAALLAPRLPLPARGRLCWLCAATCLLPCAGSVVHFAAQRSLRASSGRLISWNLWERSSTYSHQRAAASLTVISATLHCGLSLPITNAPSPGASVLGLCVGFDVQPLEPVRLQRRQHLRAYGAHMPCATMIFAITPAPCPMPPTPNRPTSLRRMARWIHVGAAEERRHQERCEEQTPAIISR